MLAMLAAKALTHLKLLTDRVRSTTGRLCFDSCLSICLSTPGGVPWPGPGGWRVPQPGPARAGGTQPQSPHQTWLGGTPARSSWVPPIGPGWGIPQRGVVPHLGYPIGPGQGGYPDGGTPPWVPPVRPGWGVP